MILFSHFKLFIELLHFIDNFTIFELAVWKHRSTGKTLLPNVCRLLRYLVSDPFPVRMIEGVCGFSQFSVMDAEGLATNNRRTVKIGDTRIHPNGH